MCKAGGPRCPETPGKKARVKFNRKVNKLVEQSGLSRHEWKEQNLEDYNNMMQEFFPEIEEEEEDLSWLNYREIGVRSTSGGSYIAEEAEDTYDYLDDEDDYYGGNFEEYLTPDEIAYIQENYEFYGNDYGDLISENPEDVNAFLQAEMDQVNEDIHNSTEPRSEKPKTIEEIAEILGYPVDTEAINADTDAYAYSTEDRSSDGSAEALLKKKISNAHLLPKDAKIISPNPNPVFVYGTLRSGQGNYKSILRGNTQKEQESAFLPGSSMYTNGAFPYVVEEDQGSGVSGDLMFIDYDSFQETMQSLDYLEGTNNGLSSDSNHYNRTLRYVQTGDKEYTQAWVYLPPDIDRSRITQLPQVPTGDWINKEKGDNG